MASNQGPIYPTLRANPFPEVTDLFCRLPLSTLALQAITAVDGGSSLHPQLIEEYGRRMRAISKLRSEGAEREAGRVEHFTAALTAVATSRSELIRLHRARKIHESVLRILEDELDLEELRLRALLERTAVIAS